MASNEERIRQLIAENLEVDGKPVDASISADSSLTDAGVSSMDIVSFARVIQDEFGIKFGVEQCAELQTVGALISYLDANAS